MLEAFSAPGRFLRGNLHCHSNRSDGDPSPERVCRFYRTAGYDFVCLSDHFLERFGFPITDTTAFRTEDFTTILGAELHAGATSVGEKWHILGVGLPADFAPTAPEETGPELAQRAADAGAFVALPHPEWYSLTTEDALTVEAAVAVETFNAICAHEAARGEGSALLDQLLNKGRRLGAIAVDDAHRYREDGLGGWVMVKATERSPEAILAALKAGQYYASQGPAIEHVERDGDFVNIETSPAVSIHLVGHGPRPESVHGEAIGHARLPLEPFARKWCRAIVTDQRGKRAWTNPLWLDA